jgi:hypothetical protein
MGARELLVTEQDLTRTIIAAVLMSRLAHVWRTHSGQVKVRGAWMHLAPQGTADVTGYMLDGSGRVVGLEVKLPKEQPTREQLTWRDGVIAAGGVAEVVRSVSEAIDVLRAAAWRRS